MSETAAKEKEKKKGGVLLPLRFKPGSGSSWGYLESQVLQGSASGSWLSRYLHSALPWLPRLVPGEGLFGLTLSSLLASKIGFIAAFLAIAATTAAGGLYLKGILNPNPLVSSGASFAKHPYDPNAKLGADKGYDNSMFLFNDANRGAAEGIASEEALRQEKENGSKKNDDPLVLTGPPPDAYSASELAKKLKEAQEAKDKAEAADPSKYGRTLGPYGGGGAYFAQGAQGAGSVGSFWGARPMGEGGKSSSALGKKAAVGIRPRPAFGSSRMRSAMDQLRNARAFSNAARRMSAAPASSTASRPFDATNPGGGAITGGPTPIGGAGITGGGGVAPDTTSGSGGVGSPNNTSGGSSTSPYSGSSMPEPKVVPPPKDVTPWGEGARLANNLILIASLLLLAAQMLGKNPSTYALAKWLAYAALFLSVIVIILGIMMITQYGQMLQGGIYTLAGAVLTYLAYRAAESISEQEAQEVAKHRVGPQVQQGQEQATGKGTFRQ